MSRRVGLQYRTRKAKSAVALQVRKPHASSRGEGLVIHQDLADFLISRGGGDTVPGQPHDPARVSKQPVTRVGIREELEAEWIEVDRARPGWRLVVV